MSDAPAMKPAPGISRSRVHYYPSNGQPCVGCGRLGPLFDFCDGSLLATAIRLPAHASSRRLPANCHPAFRAEATTTSSGLVCKPCFETATGNLPDAWKPGPCSPPDRAKAAAARRERQAQARAEA